MNANEEMLLVQLVQNETYAMAGMDLPDDQLDDLLYDKKYAPEAQLQQKVFDVLLKVFA